MVDNKILERNQSRWTKAAEGMEGLSDGKLIQTLNTFSILVRLLRADLKLIQKMCTIKRGIRINGFFDVPPSSSARVHRLKIFHFVVAWK